MENGVTWWVMSMMRASGAIPTITALQMATASLAVPKSVMKTIVGRKELWAAADSFCAGDFEQAATRVIASSRTTNERGREIIYFFSEPSGKKVYRKAQRKVLKLPRAGRLPAHWI